MSRQRAFTLLEVLVALAIFALVAASVLSATSGSLQGAQRLEQKVFASWLADNQLQMLQLQAEPPALGRSQGQSQFAGQRWAWQQEVVVTSDPHMLRVELLVMRLEESVAPAAIAEQALANVVAFVGIEP